MRVSDLNKELESFLATLNAHYKLWGDSLSGAIPEVARNHEDLQAQSSALSRKLGALRPYIERFDSEWMMQHPGTGRTWDALENAVSMASIPLIKGHSVRHTVPKIEQILGQLSTLEATDDVPADRSKLLKSGLGADRLRLAYLDHLHPFISAACSELYRNEHYPQAVEKSAKAVFQYLRNVSGLSGDGAALAQAAFSVKTTVLAFSDLKDTSKLNEQVGFMEMLSAYVKAVRHPLAHTQGTKGDAPTTFDYLVMASLLCRRIDDAAPKGVSP